MNSSLNYMQIRKDLITNKDFLKQLYHDEGKRAILRKATNEQLYLIGQLIYLIMNQKIPLTKNNVEKLVQKRKKTYLLDNFSTDTALNTYNRLTKAEKLSICLNIVSIYKELFFYLFNVA
jgi:hypothetical protein